MATSHGGLNSELEYGRNIRLPSADSKGKVVRIAGGKRPRSNGQTYRVEGCVQEEGGVK